MTRSADNAGGISVLAHPGQIYKASAVESIIKDLKFYGLKGIGCLIKKDKVELEPMIYGGKSTTVYRSGTPALPLIVSLAKALRLAQEDLNSKYERVKEYSHHLCEGLEKIDGIIMNHTDACIPHIVNFSVVGVKPETMLHALEEHDIFISTKTGSFITASGAAFRVT